MAAEDPTVTSKDATQDAFSLLQDMLRYIAPSALVLPLGEPGSEPTRPFVLVTSFYGVHPSRPFASSVRKPQPLATATEDLFSFTLACVTSLGQAGQATQSTQCFLGATRLLTQLVAKASEKQKATFQIQLNADKWRDAVLDYVEKVTELTLSTNAVKHDQL
jgi:hypothetical protein